MKNKFKGKCTDRSEKKFLRIIDEDGESILLNKDYIASIVPIEETLFDDEGKPFLYLGIQFNMVDEKIFTHVMDDCWYEDSENPIEAELEGFKEIYHDFAKSIADCVEGLW